MFEDVWGCLGMFGDFWGFLSIFWVSKKTCFGADTKLKGFFEGFQRILSTLSVSSPRQRRVPFQDAHGFSEILRDSQRFSKKRPKFKRLARAFAIAMLLAYWTYVNLL